MPAIRVSAQLQPAALRLARHAAGVGRGRGARRRLPLQLGPLLPAARRAGREALRGADRARRDGGGDRARRARLAGHLQRYRNPDYLADAHRTIDHISGGRAILGIGAGWFQRDFDEYGYDFGTVGTRLTALEEALPRIERRLGRLNPPPLRDRIPILIGGGGVKRTLKLVARHADIWHAFGSVDVFREKSAILDEHCAAEGRDPAAIERSWSVSSRMGDTPDRLREAGVTHFTVGITGSATGYDLGLLRELVAWRDGLA